MPTPISSSHNPRFKSAMKLKTSRGRRQQNKIIIFGTRESGRAIKAGVAMDALFMHDPTRLQTDKLRTDNLRTDNLMQGETSEDNLTIQNYVAEHPDHAFLLSTELYEQLAYGDRIDQVIAVANRPELNLDQIQLSKRPLIVVLESVEKPGNIGAVVRTMDAVGADALILSDAVTDIFNPNSIRAGMGCMFGLQVVIETSQVVKTWLLDHSINIFATIVGQGNDYTEANFCSPSAIVLGNEASGLSAIWQQPQVTPIQLPMLGEADSLNVSVTSAVICYEALRQRRNKDS